MKKHSGFSLVELMIAMIIAMIVLLVVSQVYVGGLRTQRAQTEVLRLNESARFAFDLVTRELRKAGHRNVWQLGSTANEFCNVPGPGEEARPAFVGLNDPATLHRHIGALRQAVVAEFAIGLLIVGITAAMVVSPPATNQTETGAPTAVYSTRILHDVVLTLERST